MQESTVSISQASRILGVSEVALRQWTDEGRIKAFITPGGHRRYSTAELKRFMHSHHKMLGLKDLATRLEDSAPILRETSKMILQSSSLSSKLDRISQEQFACLGRNLLSLIVKCVTEPSGHAENLKAARELGYSFGGMTAKAGMSLIDSVQAFIRHRGPIISTVTDLIKKKEGSNNRIIDAIAIINHVLDEALTSLVVAHQQYKGSPQQTNQNG